MRSVFSALMILSLMVFSIEANAYYSTMDTGEVVQPGHYKAMLEPQILFNKTSGVNIVGKFDTGIADDQSVRALVGFGEVDFQLGGMYKWIPFPDTENQPAIGFMAGVIYASVADESELNFRFHPIVSKKFETEIGDLIPYASVPFGLTTRDGKSTVPFQLAAGTEWKTLHSKTLTFLAELGINLNKSYSYLSLGAAYAF